MPKSLHEHQLLNRAITRAARYIGSGLSLEAQQALIKQEEAIEETTQKLHTQRRESIRIVEEIFKI